MDRTEAETPQQPPKDNDKTLIEPLEIISNFEFIPANGEFRLPFATEEEFYGFLSGEEGTVLCTKGKPICSKNFVECSGALIRNRRTGLISAIHQSTPSVAAGAILAAQRADEIDVIEIEGLCGRAIPSSTYKFFHEKADNPYEKAFAAIDRTDPYLYPVSQSEFADVRHCFGTSRIKGVSKAEMEEMFARSRESGTIGGTNLLGIIRPPTTGRDAGRLSFLYRPEENIIWVHTAGSRQLSKFPGFPPITPKQ